MVIRQGNKENRSIFLPHLKNLDSFVIPATPWMGAGTTPLRPANTAAQDSGQAGATKKQKRHAVRACPL